MNATSCFEPNYHVLTIPECSWNCLKPCHSSGDAINLLGFKVWPFSTFRGAIDRTIIGRLARSSAITANEVRPAIPSSLNGPRRGCIPETGIQGPMLLPIMASWSLGGLPWGRFGKMDYKPYDQVVWRKFGFMRTPISVHAQSGQGQKLNWRKTQVCGDQFYPHSIPVPIHQSSNCFDYTCSLSAKFLLQTCATLVWCRETMNFVGQQGSTLSVCHLRCSSLTGVYRLSIKLFHCSSATSYTLLHLHV